MSASFAPAQDAPVRFDLYAQACEERDRARDTAVTLECALQQLVAAARLVCDAHSEVTARRSGPPRRDWKLARGQAIRTLSRLTSELQPNPRRGDQR